MSLSEASGEVGPGNGAGEGLTSAGFAQLMTFDSNTSFDKKAWARVGIVNFSTGYYGAKGRDFGWLNGDPVGGAVDGNIQGNPRWPKHRGEAGTTG